MRRLILSSVLAAAALVGPAPAASAAPVAPAVPAAARGFIPIGTVVIIGQHGYLWNGFHWVMIW